MAASHSLDNLVLLGGGAVFLDSVMKTPDYQTIKFLYSDKTELTTDALKQANPALLDEDLRDLVDIGPAERQKNAELKQVMDKQGFTNYFSRDSVKRELIQRTLEYIGRNEAEGDFDSAESYEALANAFDNAVADLLGQNPELRRKAIEIAQTAQFVHPDMAQEARYMQFRGILATDVLMEYCLQREQGKNTLHAVALGSLL